MCWIDGFDVVFLLVDVFVGIGNFVIDVVVFLVDVVDVVLL